MAFVLLSCQWYICVLYVKQSCQYRTLKCKILKYTFANISYIGLIQLKHNVFIYAMIC